MKKLTKEDKIDIAAIERRKSELDIPFMKSLDVIMTEHGLTNADLVRVSTEQLTFKMVQKARKGKPITPNVQKKIDAALKTALARRSPSAGDSLD